VARYVELSEGGEFVELLDDTDAPVLPPDIERQGRDFLEQTPANNSSQ
jgi:hypothetical protein